MARPSLTGAFFEVPLYLMCSLLIDVEAKRVEFNRHEEERDLWAHLR